MRVQGFRRCAVGMYCRLCVEGVLERCGEGVRVEVIHKHEKQIFGKNNHFFRLPCFNAHATNFTSDECDACRSLNRVGVRSTKAGNQK